MFPGRKKPRGAGGRGHEAARSRRGQLRSREYKEPRGLVVAPYVSEKVKGRAGWSWSHSADNVAFPSSGLLACKVACVSESYVGYSGSGFE